MGYEVSIKAAKDRFSELIRSVENGEHVSITRNGKPVADLVAPKPRTGGIDFEALAKWREENGGPLVTYIAPDFDEPLPDDFWFPDD